MVPAGANGIRRIQTVNHALAVGDLGNVCGRVRVRPLWGVGATEPQRLYHSQTPGFYINGTDASSLSSPIVVPASATAIEYRVTADLGAGGTNLVFDLKTTNDYQGANCSGTFYAPKLTSVDFLYSNVAMRVTFATASNLIVALPEGTNGVRFHMRPRQPTGSDYGIRDLYDPDWVRVKAGGPGVSPTNTTLNELDWRSAQRYDKYNPADTRGILLNQPGVYTLQAGIVPHTETTTTKNKIIDFVPRAAHSLFPGEERPAEAKTGKPLLFSFFLSACSAGHSGFLGCGQSLR